MFQANLESRYSFAPQFLRGAALFARRAHRLEQENASFSEELKTEHRAYVVSAVIQSVAALEAEAAEISRKGPAHHLGSNPAHRPASERLAPFADVIDNQPGVLRKYELILLLLEKPPLERGEEPHQSANLLVSLRNEIVHYKSMTGSEMERKKLITRLKNLHLEPTPSESAESEFFPNQLLSSSCASWSVLTSSAFINEVFSRLEISSPMAPYEESLSAPSVRYARQRKR